MEMADPPKGLILIRWIPGLDLPIYYIWGIPTIFQVARRSWLTRGVTPERKDWCRRLTPTYCPLKPLATRYTSRDRGREALGFRVNSLSKD